MITEIENMYQNKCNIFESIGKHESTQMYVFFVITGVSHPVAGDSAETSLRMGRPTIV